MKGHVGSSEPYNSRYLWYSGWGGGVCLFIHIGGCVAARAPMAPRSRMMHMNGDMCPLARGAAAPHRVPPVRGRWHIPLRSGEGAGHRIRRIHVAEDECGELGPQDREDPRGQRWLRAVGVPGAGAAGWGGSTRRESTGTGGVPGAR